MMATWRGGGKVRYEDDNVDDVALYGDVVGEDRPEEGVTVAAVVLDGSVEEHQTGV